VRLKRELQEHISDTTIGGVVSGSRNRVLLSFDIRNFVTRIRAIPNLRMICSDPVAVPKMAATLSEFQNRSSVAIFTKFARPMKRFSFMVTKLKLVKASPITDDRGMMIKKKTATSMGMSSLKYSGRLRLPQFLYLGAILT